MLIDEVTQVPRSLSFDQAATISCGISTAAIGLYGTVNGINLIPPWERGGYSKYKGWPILILGGAGSVGNYGKLPYRGSEAALIKHYRY